jgi:hypothetical protein
MWTRLDNRRGSTLLLTMILLLVLTAAGVAAVSITGLERENAAIQSRYQKLVECGSAAQAVIWAQLARYGTNYIGSGMPIGKLTLPDGTQLAAPIHYDQDAATAFANISYTVQSGGGGQGTADVDCTNKLCGQTGGGNPVLIVARCTDPSANGRQYEVELSFAFAL